MKHIYETSIFERYLLLNDAFFFSTDWSPDSWQLSCSSILIQYFKHVLNSNKFFEILNIFGFLSFFRIILREVHVYFSPSPSKVSQLSFSCQKTRNILKHAKTVYQFFYIFSLNKILIWKKMLMKNVVVLRSHSNSDLHTFQKTEKTRKKIP